ncbi:MAG: L,D-transpeptidase [Acidimicrobiales bacterium]
MDDAAETTGTGASRMTVLLTAAFAVVMCGLAVLVDQSLESKPAEAAPMTTTTVAPTTTTTTTTTPAPVPVVPVSTPLATPIGEIPVYDRPDGDAIWKAGFWYGYPMTMPIVEDRGAWLRIMLPERPNGGTGWVRADSVTRSTSPWRMVLKLSETRVRVYKDGFEVWNAPVGIGRDRTRTPTGSYFVTVIEKPGPPGYGPIVLNLNAHSEDIASWHGSGDAITAFHGPFGAQELIRSGGGKVSNGCIRMLTEDQLKMDGITLGTPVDIVA